MRTEEAESHVIGSPAKDESRNWKNNRQKMDQVDVWDRHLQ